MQFNKQNLTNTQLIHLYKKLITPRLIEEKMLIILRQGKISKWFSAWGQEAISVGCTEALFPHEYICTMHRNLGVFTSRNIPFHRLFSQFQGKKNGFTQGRDRSFHFGTNEFSIVGMISHLGAQMGVADGIALANTLSKSKEVCVVFTGDGGASEGDFHEAVNTAAVWQLPVIIIVENNQWGLSTPSSEQFKCKSFADKGIGYGIEAISIDGNNILEVYLTIKKYAEQIRENPKPVLIECVTFRMRGHEEASGTAYYPKGLQDKWKEYDPITNYENFLIDENILSKNEIEHTKKEILAEIEEGLDKTFDEPTISVNTEKEISEVFAPFHNDEIYPTKTANREIRFIDAISEGLDLAMQRHNNLVLMGQDIAEYGGAFKVTEGFIQTFGKERVRNTPLCEAAILGSALGLSIKGYKSMVEMQFADFVSEGFNQIVNNIAKSHYRWKQNADVVVRMPTGAGTAAGPFHSQSNEAWFTKVAGLKIAYPSNPYDAKGLLLQSFEDPNPILFFEHKKLYRSLTANVPEEYYTIPFGKANVVNKGNDISIITYGYGVIWAKELAEKHKNYSIEIIDLRTLIPLDTETIYNSVQKTGKVMIVHEDTLTSGFGGEIAALIAEHCFEYLDAPIVRVASLDTPIPFSKPLEDNFLANKYLEDKFLQLIEY